MSERGLAAEILAALALRGFTETEVYLKRGRARRFELAPSGEVAASSQEEGWAVRAGGRRRSFFAAGSGRPAPSGPWPEGSPPALHLPAPQEVPAWRPAEDLALPLIGEGEGHALLEGVGRELGRELPGALLRAAWLEDGASEAELLSSRGIAAQVRQRLASLRLEALGPQGGRAVAVEIVEREARRFRPLALARRLADLLVAAAAPAATAAGCDGLLAPPVVARLLAALAPLLCGPTAGERLAPLLDARGRLGSPCLEILDDGRFPGGPIDAPVDGEGVPTREVVLVERGQFRQPLLAWWEVRGPVAAISGCTRRASYRDLPRRAPSHLLLRPDPAVGVAMLVAGVDHGFYALEATGRARFDLARGRFELPICGLRLEGGRAVAPFGSTLLAGELRQLFGGIEAVARDLTFLADDGFLGAPSALVRGLDLVPATECRD